MGCQTQPKSISNRFSKMENQNSESPKKNYIQLQQLLHFGDYNINYTIKIFHTFNKILFLFPKHLISRFLISENIIKKYIYLSW